MRFHLIYVIVLRADVLSCLFNYLGFEKGTKTTWSHDRHLIVRGVTSVSVLLTIKRIH